MNKSTIKRNTSSFLGLFICNLGLWLSACTYPVNTQEAGFFQQPIELQNANLGSSRIALDFSPDGQWLAAYQGLSEKHSTIKIWNTHTGKLKYSTKVGGAAGYDDKTWQTLITFSPDSKTVILTGQIGSMVLWDFTKNKQTREICSGENTGLMSISEDRHYLYMLTSPGHHLLCDMDSKALYFAGKLYPADVVLTRENKLLAIYLLPAHYSGHYSKGDPYDTKISAQGNEKDYVGHQQSMKYIDFWKLHLSKEEIDLTEHRFLPLFNPDKERYTVFDHKEKTLTQWNYSTRKQRWKIKLNNLQRVNKLSHSPNFNLSTDLAKQKIALLSHSKLTIIDSDTGKTIWQHSFHASAPKDRSLSGNLTFSTDGKRIITHNNAIDIFDASNGKLLFHYNVVDDKPPLSGYLYQVDPSGKYLIYPVKHKVTGEDTGKIIALNFADEKTVIIQGSNYPVVFTDGKIALIESIENDNILRLWKTGL